MDTGFQNICAMYMELFSLKLQGVKVVTLLVPLAKVTAIQSCAKGTTSKLSSSCHSAKVSHIFSKVKQLMTQTSFVALLRKARISPASNRFPDLLDK